MYNVVNINTGGVLAKSKSIVTASQAQQDIITGLITARITKIVGEHGDGWERTQLIDQVTYILLAYAYYESYIVIESEEDTEARHHV